MRERFYPILMFLLALAVCLNGQPQELRFHHIGVEDGLSHSLVTSIAEDNLGFIWFGTQDGLNRFDGYEFKVYYKGESNRHPSDSWINRLYIDRENQLWIVYSGSGLERFDPVTETFHAYKPDTSDASAISSNAYSTRLPYAQGVFFEDSGSRLWIGTEEGLNCYHRETDDFQVYRADPGDTASLSHNEILCITEDQDAYLWIGTPEGLNRLDPETGRVKRYSARAGSQHHLNNDFISSIFSASDGSLWVGTRDGGLNILENPHSENPRVSHLITRPLDPNRLPSIHDIKELSQGKMLVATLHGVYKVTAGHGGYKAEPIPETMGVEVRRMTIDSEGYTWVASRDNDQKSLFRLDPAADGARVFEVGGENSQMLGGRRILALLESRDGQVWIGTEKKGVYRVDLNARKFRVINAHEGRRLRLSDAEVYSIFEDKNGKLYVGTKSALNRLDLRSGEMYNFHNALQFKRDVKMEYSSHLPARLVGVMEPDPQGRIWMGSFDYKASLYDPSLHRFLNFHHVDDDSSAFHVWSLRAICITRNDEVYFGGTENGLCRLRNEDYSFEYYPVIPGGDPGGTNDNQIQCVTEDEDGILWLGTFTGGLNRLDPATGIFKHFIHNPDNPESISDNRVKWILEPQIYNDGILWIGTHGGGLNRFSKEAGTFRSFTMDDGLPSNTIHCILEDKKGRLWISTNRGIARFDPLTESFSVFTSEDGISGNEFNEGACFKNSEGILYFGGTRGITYFDPDEISEKPDFRIPVIFTNFSVAGEPVLARDTIRGRVILDRSISYTERISLNHRDRYLSFGFSAPDMAAPGKLRYRYMLEGFDESWHVVDARHRYISYANLPSGNYQLKVAASNSEGTLFREPSVLEIQVMPPFWERPVFRIFLLLLVIGLFFMALRFRTRMLHRQKIKLAKEVEERSEEVRVMAEKLRESDQMKLKFFTNISHEIRTPLTLIMGPTEKLLEREELAGHPQIREELELMYRNERRLYKLINQLLELRRVETGNLELSVAEDDLVAFIQNIHQLFRPFADREEIEFLFKADSDKLHLLFDADKIEKILYNLLSNAFKFTPEGGRIRLSCDEAIRDEQTWVRISVEDTGYGIPAERLPHIFDRFYQNDEKMSGGENSTGIGLSLSRDLAEKHHGFIQVQSTEGKGTRFELFIPADPGIYKEGEIQKDAVSSAGLEYISSMLDNPAYGRPGSCGDDEGEELPRILIVEDNPDLRSYLRGELSPNYLLSFAEDGAEGLELAGRELPDLIISDVMMPKMDGHEFCRKIREDGRTSHIPLVMLTARTEPENQLAGLASGADDYITKPFHADILKQKLKNILDSRKYLADKFSRATSYIPDQVKISQIDQGFLEKIIKLVEDNIDNTDLSGDMLAREMGMSKGNLYKKLKALSGMTVNIFVRTIRLKVAARLLKQGNYNISEVAYAVGFNNPKYFSTCFSELFSVSPKEYMK